MGVGVGACVCYGIIHAARSTKDTHTQIQARRTLTAPPMTTMDTPWKKEPQRTQFFSLRNRGTM